jgi:RNA polymerase sigma-70 factor (sigma-E family)
MTFEQYARRQLPTLLRTARAISGDAHLAEDLVQDVLLKLQACWDSVSVMAAPDAYVRRMLVNEFLSWRRKWGRLVPQAEVAEPASGSDHAARHAERDQLLTEVNALPPRQRVVIALRYLADLPDGEIAEALGCSPSTVRVHAARALATLRVARAGGHTLDLLETGVF